MKSFLFFSRLLVLFVMTLFSSCTKEEPTAPAPLPGPPSISGYWSGTLQPYGAPFAITITDADGVIEGTGSIGVLLLKVNGEKTYPDVNFIITSPGYQPATFEGEFTGLKTIVGVFNGSGFINADIVLTKN